MTGDRYPDEPPIVIPGSWAVRRDNSALAGSVTGLHADGRDEQLDFPSYSIEVLARTIDTTCHQKRSIVRFEGTGGRIEWVNCGDRRRCEACRFRIAEEHARENLTGFVDLGFGTAEHPVAVEHHTDRRTATNAVSEATRQGHPALVIPMQPPHALLFTGRQRVKRPRGGLDVRAALVTDSTLQVGLLKAFYEMAPFSRPKDLDEPDDIDLQFIGKETHVVRNKVLLDAVTGTTRPQRQADRARSRAAQGDQGQGESAYHGNQELIRFLDTHGLINRTRGTFATPTTATHSPVVVDQYRAIVANLKVVSKYQSQ